MKELCRYIKKDGNFNWLFQLFFAFVMLAADLLVFVDPDLNTPIRIFVPAMLSYAACVLKFDSITQVNDWGEKQVVNEGLLLFPISRKMLLKTHYLEMLKTEVGYFILWCVMHLCFIKKIELIEFLWLILLFAIPGMVLLLKEGFLIFHRAKN